MTAEKHTPEPTIEVADFTGVRIHENTTLDYPTAWAIQNEVGPTLQHHPRCSSVPGWDKISGPHFLCDCGAVEREWNRRAAIAKATSTESESAHV